MVHTTLPEARILPAKSPGGPDPPGKSLVNNRTKVRYEDNSDIICVAFAALDTGLMLNQDISSGVFDRFRSLPIARWAPLAGAVLGDMVRYLSVAITIAFGTILGFRVTTNPVSAVAACLLLLASPWLCAGYRPSSACW